MGGKGLPVPSKYSPTLATGPPVGAGAHKKVLRESKFKEHGRITPGKLLAPDQRVKAEETEEFVAAGDFLAFKFPVWQWYVLS